jgi:hypothetical protein
VKVIGGEDEESFFVFYLSISLHNLLTLDSRSSPFHNYHIWPKAWGFLGSGKALGKARTNPRPVHHWERYGLGWSAMASWLFSIPLLFLRYSLGARLFLPFLPYLFLFVLSPSRFRFLLHFVFSPPGTGPNGQSPSSVRICEP